MRGWHVPQGTIQPFNVKSLKWRRAFFGHSSIVWHDRNNTTSWATAMETLSTITQEIHFLTWVPLTKWLQARNASKPQHMCITNNAHDLSQIHHITRIRYIVAYMHHEHTYHVSHSFVIYSSAGKTKQTKAYMLSYNKVPSLTEANKSKQPKGDARGPIPSQKGQQSSPLDSLGTGQLRL